MQKYIETVGSLRSKIQGLDDNERVLALDGRVCTLAMLSRGIEDRHDMSLSTEALEEFIQVVLDQIEPHVSLMEEAAEAIVDEQRAAAAELKSLAEKEAMLEKELAAVKFAKRQAMGIPQNCTPVQKQGQVKHYQVKDMEKSQVKPLPKASLEEAKAQLEGKFHVTVEVEHPLTKALAQATPSMMARLETFVQEYKPLAKVEHHTVQSLEDKALTEAPGAYLEGVRL